MGFTVTCPELAAVMRDLRKTDNELAKEIKRDIRQAEQPAKRAMQQAALSATRGPMKKASRAVKPSNRFVGKGASLGLKVDAAIAPNARPLDKPNDGDFNKHPVWGHWDRAVEQPAHYFFDKGSVAAFDACQKEMEEALAAVVRFLGRG